LDAAERPVDFGRDIQPLLADRCYTCHGPDGEQRQAELRLDLKEHALADRDGEPVIRSGKPNASPLVQRIESADPDMVMPPADSNLHLSPDEIALIRRWVKQGAKWDQHWSLVAPKRPKPPAVKLSDWASNPIDRFVLSRLEQEKLSPSPVASRRTLLRRASLDLTGLPPTPQEMAAFLADQSPGAYDRAIDHMLASPRYGERMALPWLDAARYADTSGYQNDGPRFMWRWRDWVIESLNANMPFDQFTREQLAGDLFPDATLSQQIASGFNRNHRANSEGGIIPEEYAVEYVVDRVDTTATIWLGLTMGCARCHDHKYDPLSQEDFYRFYAYFNNVPESGRARKEDNSPPFISAPTKLQQREYAQVTQQLAKATAQFRAAHERIGAEEADWAAKAQPESLTNWNYATGMVAHFPLDTAEPQGDHALKPQGEPFDMAPGQVDQAAVLSGEQWGEADVAKFGYFDAFTISAWIKPTSGGAIVSRMSDKPLGDGYSVAVEDGKIHVRLVKRWLDDAIRVETLPAPIKADEWSHVTVTYDGSRVASAIRIYVNGKPQKINVLLDGINQSFVSEEPLRIGAGGGPDARFQGMIDEVRIFDRVVRPADVALLATPTSIKQIVAAETSDRSPAQRRKLRAYFLREQAPPKTRKQFARLLQLRERSEELMHRWPTVMVMQEQQEVRPAFVLQRGQYDKPGKQVDRGTPTSLPSFPNGAPSDRLGLAEWIVDPRNPLTARVAVNRAWQLFFGVGLVASTEDFGAQGERPSHPALLDWLAVEFVESGWDVKHLHRLIVTSAAYQQSSKATAELIARDPDNRLLARGPRFRLSAHAVRDQALFVSGLLVEQTGGPSVKPQQPPGLWKEIANEAYEPGTGADLVRRSLYTYWKRTVASPTLATFDAASRETCIVRPARTNTPLQALALMNDATFVDAAKGLARRVLAEHDQDTDRIAAMFARAVGREPTDRESEILLRGLEYHRELFAKSPANTKKFVTPEESGPAPEDWAAFTALANTILNLDEAITKE